MKIEILQFCEHAETRDSQLHLTGITDTVYSRQIPYRAENLKVVVRFRISGSEVGSHRFGFMMIDSDGKALLKQNGNLDVGMEPHLTSAVSDMIIGLDGVIFPKAGEYEFSLIHNDVQVASTPFFVFEGVRPS